MNFWANLVGYQCVWFAAVIGAGRGLWWPGMVAAALFALLHLALCRQTPAQRAVDFRLMAVAIGCGLLLDGSIASAGLADYAADDATFPLGGAPLWILSLWAAFSLTLRHSMTFLLGRSWLTAAFGAIGGPLAYLGAGRGWQAIAFAEPLWMALAALAVGWCIAITLLTLLAVRWSASAGAPAVAVSGPVR
jgi:Protein of unknown function (DUF2878)